MRLAYLIIAHQQPEQLAQMLYCIQHPDNVYLVMPDSKGLTGSEPALQAVVRRHCPGARHALGVLEPDAGPAGRHP